MTDVLCCVTPSVDVHVHPVFANVAFTACTHYLHQLLPGMMPIVLVSRPLVLLFLQCLHCSWLFLV
jgi:hypothetical protein